jgi:hypothetical protein
MGKKSNEELLAEYIAEQNAERNAEIAKRNAEVEERLAALRAERLKALVRGREFVSVPTAKELTSAVPLGSYRDDDGRIVGLPGDDGPKPEAPPVTSLGNDKKGKLLEAGHGQGTPKVSIDARMIAVCQKDPEAQYWSKRKWADTLSCSPSGIQGAKTWKVLEEFRDNARAGRALEKAKRDTSGGRPRDARRNRYGE